MTATSLTIDQLTDELAGTVANAMIDGRADSSAELMDLIEKTLRAHLVESSPDRLQQAVLSARAALQGNQPAIALEVLDDALLPPELAAKRPKSEERVSHDFGISYDR